MMTSQQQAETEAQLKILEGRLQENLGLFRVLFTQIRKEHPDQQAYWANKITDTVNKLVQNSNATLIHMP